MTEVPEGGSGATGGDGGKAEAKDAKATKTRRQLLEAYSSREESHRQRHFDFCAKQVLSVYTTFPRPFFPRDFRTVRRAGPKPREPMEPMEPREPKEPKEKEPDASKDFREAKVQVTEPLRPQSQRAWGCSPRFRSFEAYHSPCAEASRDKVLKSVPAWSFARNDVGLREGAQRPRPERATDFRRLRDAVALDEAWLEVRR